MIIKSIKTALASMILTALFFGNANSKTTVTVTGLAPEITDNFIAGVPSLLNDFDNVAKSNGPNVADAFAMANILGYPIGKSYLGSLPHFELGAVVGAGCTAMDYFDDDVPAKDKPQWPMIIPNVAGHFGLGIGQGFDILGKFFYLDKTIYDPGLSTNKAQEEATSEPSSSTDKAELKDFVFYSFGAKVRYNWIDKIPILPILLELSGVTVSLGADFMIGRFNVGGTYFQKMSDVDTVVNVPAPGTNENIDLEFEGTYDSVIEWSIFSLTTQIIGYLDLFYFFSLYTGFGLSGNFGFFNIDFDGTGVLSSADFALISGTGDPDVGTATFLTENKFRPAYLTPAYILGLEINILIVKLNIETMVNLRNGSDVNIQVGTRIGI